MLERLIPISHIYRIGRLQRGFGLLFTAFSAVFLAVIWSEAIFGTKEVSFVELIVPAVLLVAGALFTLRAFKNRITVSPEGITMQTMFARRTLPFEKIRGRRRYLLRGADDSPNIWHLKLEPNDDRFPALDFEEGYYTFDKHFLAWFNKLPDLDALDKTQPKASNFGLV